jgi:hypothetical protein
MSVRQSFLLSTWKKWAPTGRIFKKFDILILFENLSRKFTSSYSTSSSSSSSTGTTAHCGLLSVEQHPSIFSYPSPTLSIIIKSIQLFPLFDFRNNKFFTVWGC